MKQLLHETMAYRTIAAEGTSAAQTTLVLFPDEAYLRDLLRECAAAFFGAREGSRTAELIAREHHPDCLFFPAAGGKWTAEDCSRIVEECLLRPVEEPCKLFVLDALHTASALVQNKLLKALEEPPAGVFFLLGATAEFAVLPTVLSRARKIAVTPFSEEQVAALLTRKAGSSAGIAEAAAASGGIVSSAEALLSGGGEEFRLARQFLERRELEALCREIGERKEKGTFFAALRLLLRDVLFYRTGHGAYAALRDKDTRALAERYPAGVAVRALDWAADAEREIRFNANFGQCALALAAKIGKELEKWQTLS